MSRFDYHQPRSLEEAFRLMREIPGARLIAGGTDLMVKLRSREIAPPALISLRSIQVLQGIQPGETARIGALATIAELVGSPELLSQYPVLVEAARKLGSPQIRNVATIGGNLCNCSPCADTATPLLVLEARLRVQGPRGCRELAIQEFFVGPGQSCLAPDEILTDIQLDPPPKGSLATFMKKGRVKMDLAIASVAVLLQMKGKKCRKARLAAGSVAPVPLRLSKVEALLEGATLSPAVVAEAGRLARESVSPITDIRSSEDYRRQIVGVYTRRALEQLRGGSLA